MRKRLACLALVAGLAAARLSAGDIPGFTWKGKPNFPGFARGMTTGPDGNLWLTDAEANAIGRVAMDGTVVDDYKLGTYTSFPIPTTNGFPLAITAGPDGALWFVEVNNGGKIGRCTTAGVITEFPLPGPSNGFPGIAGGPDGNVWLSASPYDSAHPARILKVTPAGVATAFPLAAGINVFGLVGGSDGNVWFIEKNGTTGGIGRITPEGTVTDHWLTPNHLPADLTLGPDGNIWFTESAANMIGRITTAAVITEFPIPTPNSYPWAIASGVDGNIWFTEYDAHKVGQLVVSTATDQGQATFNDSGTWTFYQAVQLIRIPESGTGTSVSVAARGTAAASVANASAHCPQTTFIVRDSSSGLDNATVIAGSGSQTCADIAVVSQRLQINWGRDWYFAVSLTNNGPDPALNVTLNAGLLASEALVLGKAGEGVKVHGRIDSTCDLQGNRFRCRLPLLEPSEKVEFVVPIVWSDQPPVAGSRVHGFAIGFSDTPDGHPANNFQLAEFVIDSFGSSLVAYNGIILPSDPNALKLVQVQKRGGKWY